MQNYVILSRIDGDIQAWYVELPDGVFEKFETDGCSTRGDLGAILQEVKEYFAYECI